MNKIDIKLKSYKQLQFEIMKLNTDIVLKDREINDLKSSIADYQEAVGDYQDEIIRKDNIINELNKDLDYYKHEEELYRYYQQENPRLMNNWNELKKYINKMIEKDKKYTDIASRYGVLNCKSILNKIKKLEGKK